MAYPKAKCPNCGSTNTVQTATHDTGVNAYICASCGCRWGN